MANSNMDVLYPEFWAAAFDELNMGSYPLINLVRRDLQNRVAQAGDTVNVPVTPDFSSEDPTWTPGGTITPINVSQENVAVLLDKSLGPAISLNATERAKSPYDLINEYGTALAEAVVSRVERDTYLELLKTDNFVDARAGVSEDFIVDGFTEMSVNKNPTMGRRLAVGPEMTGALMKLDAFQHANIAGSDAVIRDGRLDRKLGFDIYESTIIAKYTPADVAGAVNNAGTAYAAGATTIVVDAFDDDANPLRAGDIFTLADEVGTPLHTVISTVKTTSDTTSITFLPALSGANPADNDDVITVIPTQSLVGFRQNACALVARSFENEDFQVGVRTTTVTINGLPIQIAVWFDDDRNLRVQYALLYGVKIINKDRVVRILEDA